MIIVFEANEQKSVVFSELMEVLERHSELEFLHLKHELPLSLDGLEIDPAHRKIHYNSKEISLTTKEYDLLYLLAANKGYVLTYNQIYQKVWKEEAFGTANNAIACHIHNLRGKLGMKMVTNLWKPTSGAVVLFGKILEAGSYEVLKCMGSIIEFPTFYEHMSGKENLQLHCECMGYYNQGSVEEALQMLDLAGAANSAVKSYSLGMKQIRDLFRMLCTEYGMTIMISSHLLPEIESIADTIGVINHGKLMKEISMKEIAETNTAYIELVVADTKKAAYVLADKVQVNNFKIVDESKICIYEQGITTQKVSRELMLHDVGIISISQHSETLEDYFLKITTEVGKAC